MVLLHYIWLLKMDMRQSWDYWWTQRAYTLMMQRQSMHRLPCIMLLLEVIFLSQVSSFRGQQSHWRSLTKTVKLVFMLQLLLDTKRWLGYYWVRERRSMLKTKNSGLPFIMLLVMGTSMLLSYSLIQEQIQWRHQRMRRFLSVALLELDITMSSRTSWRENMIP